MKLPLTNSLLNANTNEDWRIPLAIWRPLKNNNYLHMKIISFFIFCFISSTAILAQAPAIQWQKCLGGSNVDEASSIQQTSDGGYIVVGYSKSTNGNVTNNYGEDDIWLVKLDNIGNVQWQKSLGGSSTERSKSVLQTSDGGYILCGYTFSTNGQVTNNNGFVDAWVVKVDSVGNILWQKTFGGEYSDYANYIIQTNDGGYIFTGETQESTSPANLWIVKLNNLGIMEWQRTYGGSSFDFGNYITQTSDNGYIVSGNTYSDDGDVVGFHGGTDYWILKLDNSGNLQWNRCYGGSSFEGVYSIIQTTDGGYIMTGETLSNDGDVLNNTFGLSNAWVVKINSTGNIQWQKTYGGSGQDIAYRVIQTNDGNYIFFCGTNSNNGNVTNNNGNLDFWLVKVNSTGTLLWQKTYGGSQRETPQDFKKTSDGGFILCGSTTSNNGNVSGNNGSADYWVVKLTPDNLNANEFETPSVVIFPNPTTNYIQISKNENILNVELYDYNGRQVLNVKNFTEIISLENFSNGVYILKIQLENGSFIQEKIIKI